jgi:hypothetical protein
LILEVRGRAAKRGSASRLFKTSGDLKGHGFTDWAGKLYAKTAECCPVGGALQRSGNGLTSIMHFSAGIEKSRG